MPNENENSKPKTARPDSHEEPGSERILADALQAFDAVAAEEDCSNSIKAYYDIPRKEYLIRTSSCWIHQTESQFKRRLRQAGISSKPMDGSLTSPADEEILRLQDHHAIDYAGPLAGHREGIYVQNGHRILVTRGPELVEPVPGDFSVLRDTFEAVLLDPVYPDQLNVFYGWLRVGTESLLSGNHMPGQALAIAGPVGCGKSLLQNLLTVMFGGRCAKPYAFMSGRTEFNAELFRAEHLIVEDEAPSTDYRARRSFGSFIKQLTVNVDQRLHAKGRDAMMLRPFWRVTISLNDEPEDLHVLPPIDASLADKLIILRAFKRNLPMPTGTGDEKARFWSALCAQIPAFMHWLLNDYSIPDSLVSDRFGVTHFHHPDLIGKLHSTSNEAEFLSLLDGCIRLPFMDTASALEAQLRQSAGRQVDKLLCFSGAVGTYLSRLANQPNPRVIKRRNSDANRWEILPRSDSATSSSGGSGGGGTL